jgi:hypothetical protein
MTGSAFAIAMAMIFVLACAHSLMDWPGYSASVVKYRLAPDWAARVIAWLLPPLQALAAGLLLVVPLWGALLGLGLMALFTGAVGINMLRGRTDIDCGCGGASGQSLSWGLVLRNVVLGLCLAVVASVPGRAMVDAAAVVGVVGAALFLATTYFAANQMLANAQAFARARA